MGVKKSLATLIEAESLLNDGTAVVVYSILLKAVQAGGFSSYLASAANSNGWHIVWVAARMSVIGPAFGALIGVLSVRWLEANAGTDRDANVEVICTLAMPFLVFYLAETAFGEAMQMSGVLAVVCYGLVFASPYGKVRIDSRVEHFLHEFWGMVGHLINTIIFTISGITIVTSIDPRRPDFGTDFGLAIASWAAMTVFRAIVMFGVIPIFKSGHYGYDWRDALVITWGGLRGAVGLALAVAVFGDTTLPELNASQNIALFGTRSNSVHFQQVVLLHVSMTVLLTLLVNAPTSAPILKAVGLTKLSNERVSMLQMAQVELHEIAIAAKLKMAPHPVLSQVNWPGVWRLACFDDMVATILGIKPSPDSPAPWDAAEDEEAEAKSPALSPSWSPRRQRMSKEAMAEMVVTDSIEAAVASAVDVATKRERRQSKEAARRRRVTKESMARRISNESSSSPDAAKAALREARTKWRMLRVKLEAASALLGGYEEFAIDFKKRLRQKRFKEAKFIMLETLQATVWNMFETGQVRPRTAQFLKQLVLEQIDNVEASRNLEVTNPLPFQPLQDGSLSFRPRVLRVAAAFESFAEASVIFRPLAKYANELVLREFGRGYDAVVGYYMGFEQVLAAHDHGHKFTLDKELDAAFKECVKQNIKDASVAIASLRLQWPKLCTALNTLRVARAILNQGESLINDLSHHGGLHETEVGRMLDMIAKASSKLSQLNPADALPPEERSHFIPNHFKKTHTQEELDKAAPKLNRKMTLTTTIPAVLVTPSVEVGTASAV